MSHTSLVGKFSLKSIRAATSFCNNKNKVMELATQWTVLLLPTRLEIDTVGIRMHACSKMSPFVCCVQVWWKNFELMNITVATAFCDRKKQSNVIYHTVNSFLYFQKGKKLVQLGKPCIHLQKITLLNVTHKLAGRIQIKEHKSFCNSKNKVI